MINIKYDKMVNSLYLTVKKGKIFKTSKITEKILIDKNINNDVLGIEIIDIPHYKKNKSKGIEFDPFKYQYINSKYEISF